MILTVSALSARAEGQVSDRAGSAEGSGWFRFGPSSRFRKERPLISLYLLFRTDFWLRIGKVQIRSRLMRILVAEDDTALASFVKKGLESEHYAVDVSADGEQARAMAGELDFDLLVLDLNLPRMDGVAILRFLRTRKPSMPILVLTGRNRVEDRVQCLDLGADDYLGKPFSFTELSARIRALMRRSHMPAESVLAVDDLKLDRVERRVERAGRRIELTSKEFCLLEYLMRNAGRRITRAMIIEHVWNLSFDTCTNVVDVYVNYLRRKVDDGYGKHLIHTIRGEGYELSVRSSAEPTAVPMARPGSQP